MLLGELHDRLDDVALGDVDVEAWEVAPLPPDAGAQLVPGYEVRLRLREQFLRPLAAEADPGAVSLTGAGHLAEHVLGDLRALGELRVDRDDWQKLAAEAGVVPGFDFRLVSRPQCATHFSCP